MAALKVIRTFAWATVALLLGSCSESLAPIEPMPGTYVLTSYSAGSTAQSRMDMIALGVRWELDIGADNSVISTTWIAGDTVAVPTQRTGAVRRRGADVTFSQFDGELAILTLRRWTLNGPELVAEDQTVNNVNATIRFTRQ
jgi:hypothetical protein